MAGGLSLRNENPQDPQTENNQRHSSEQWKRRKKNDTQREGPGETKQPKIDADFLEPSVLLDETHYQEGYKSGYNDGLPSGKEEGRQVGLKMGFQAGEELGFYQGCLDVWMSATCIDQNAFSARVRKNIEQLAALVRSYPLSDPENEQVQDMMEKIRLKFRVITASLGAKLEYEGRLASSKQEIEYL
ncbi:hypothetical protein U9M48_015413 [Paspalum notatum var. saurae]|uniref:Essential protein Yae1 N-terminal domain-containing protein n=1 Tax=Paspalum notatum var. saurae TaxID=547442 RepID=A0AAQ3T6H5_PASNO